MPAVMTRTSGKKWDGFCYDSDDALTDSLREFYEGSQHCDMVIKCGKRKWKVHKLVLALHSKVFKEICYGSSKEAKEGLIDLSGNDVDVVDAMITFLYRLGTFDHEPDEINDDAIEPMMLCVRLYALADHFNISELKETAKDELKELVEREPAWGTEEFAAAVRDMYKENYASDCSIRGIALAVVRKQKEYLVGERRTHEAFHTMAKEIPDFAVDLIQSLACGDGIDPRYEKMVHCGRCFQRLAIEASKVHGPCPSCGSTQTHE
ncbi:hypothetical protein LTR66_001084 [Elasticomyces elasticus]|nr:hypothetical protein LTR66_001084 [Elasticomyces elasticus]